MFGGRDSENGRMISNHKRNVSGMHDAPRCGAIARDGSPCRSPAVAGKKRCHVHGGKGSAAKSYRREFSDYSRAALERDKQITGQIRMLCKVMRKLQRGADGLDVLPDLEGIRRGLLKLTQQKQTVFAAAYVPPPLSGHCVADEGPLDLLRDRAVGAMVGLAVGEAVGVTLEGWKRDSYRELSDMLGGGFLGLNLELAAKAATANRRAIR